MSWVDTVDKWLEDNATRGGISNHAGMGAFYTWIFKVTFYVCTMFIGYFIVRALRTKDEFFFELIRSKNHPTQNLEDESAKKRIDKILSAEMITLSGDEEVLFLIEEGDSNDCGVIFTNSRVIYNLFKPKAITISTESGQLPISEMANKVQAKLRAFVTITINGNDIGKLSAEKGKPIEDFLNAVRKAVMNENFAN
jgi:hypothetical protein